MIIASPRIAVRPRPFQFRLATLLLAMTWVGVISLGLSTPTGLWSGMIAFLTLLAVLTAILLIIFRTGRTQAMAIGFVVFSVGWLANALDHYWLPWVGYDRPMIHLFDSLAAAIHGDGAVVDDTTAVRLTSLISGPPFYRIDFASICNDALAFLLGIAGAIAAQVLDATRKSDSPSDNE